MSQTTLGNTWVQLLMVVQMSQITIGNTYDSNYNGQYIWVKLL